MNGDLSLFRGSSPILFLDSNFIGLPSDFPHEWLGMVVEDFGAYIGLGIFLTSTALTNEIFIPLIGSDRVHFNFNTSQICSMRHDPTNRYYYRSLTS